MNCVKEWIDTLNKLENCCFSGFEGYQVSKILTIPAKEIVIGEVGRFTIKETLRTIFTTAFSDGYYYNFNRIRGAKCVLFFSHLHAARKDYVRMMNTIASCSNTALLFTGESRKGLNKVLHFNYQSFLSLFLCMSWKKELVKHKIDVKYHNYFLMDLVQMYRWRYVLDKNEDSIKTIQSVISIFDAREFENLFTQFCNRHHIVSGTLQHGHFGRQTFKNTNNYYFNIAYKGFVSDYFLAWGAYSKDCAVDSGIDNKRVFLCGCPDYISARHIIPKHNSIGVLLDGDILSKEDNVRMLKIAQQAAESEDRKVIIKLHPNDNVSKYEDCIDKSFFSVFTGTIDEFAENTAYTICCNTSALIQMLAHKAKVYHYKTLMRYDMYEVLDRYSFIDYEGLVEVRKKQNDYEGCLLTLSVSNDVSGNYNKIIEGLSECPKYTD